MDEEEAVGEKSKWGFEMRMTWTRDFLNPEVIASPKIIYSLDLAIPGVLRDESESSQTHPAERQRRANQLPVSEELEWVDVW